MVTKNLELCIPSRIYAGLKRKNKKKAPLGQIVTQQTMPIRLRLFMNAATEKKIYNNNFETRNVIMLFFFLKKEVADAKHNR